MAVTMINKAAGVEQGSQDRELLYQLELCKIINNYFIDINHTNYILINSICNNQNLQKRKQKYTELNRRILKIFFPNYYGDIENNFYPNNLLFIIHNLIIIEIDDLSVICNCYW